MSYFVRTLSVIFLNLILGVGLLNAQDIFQPMGTSLTRGGVSHNADFRSIAANPAAPSVFAGAHSGFSSSFIAPFGAGYELGKVDSLIDELDELIDILEQDELSAEEALDAKDRFDPFLQSAAEDGMVKVAGHLGIPFFPMFYHTSDYGTFTANLHASGSLRSTVLADDIDILIFGDTFQINTAASVYVKSTGIINLGLGYSSQIWAFDSGSLNAGIKANINQIQLSKNIISLAGLEDGDDIGDAIQDDYENNANSTTNLGIDVGLMWSAKNYRIGLSVHDINEPEYDYGSLASSCEGRVGISLDNCFVAQQAIATGQIRANETYIANAQAKFEASAWLGKQEDFGIHTSVDLNDKNDPIGDLYQWASVSASANLQNWLVPEFRFGYSKNLVGTELSYYSVGVTFFKQADLDVRWSDESVEVDNDRGPRSAHFSFSIQTRF